MSAEDPSHFPWEHSWPEITDARVREAFARVPRAAFVDAELRPFADRDAPLPIGEGQTISQPFVVALMVQLLCLDVGDKVLEIGTGSGFQTAILCEMAAEGGEPPGATVYSIERMPKLAQRAAALLHDLGYWPHLREGDGAAGWPEAAPFAAILVSAAAEHVPLPLWEQLAEGGRLVLPIGEAYGEQDLWVVRRQQGKMMIENLGGVRFVPLLSELMDDPNNWAEGAGREAGGGGRGASRGWPDA